VCVKSGKERKKEKKKVDYPSSLLKGKISTPAFPGAMQITRFGE
jgi:hypothetical protein